MKISHVVENLNRGGLERMVLDLVALQSAQGHQVQVICVFEPGALAGELEALGVTLVACGKRRGPDLRALRRLRRAVKIHGTEVMHTHNASAHYQAVLATFGLRVPRVINTRHGMGAGTPSARRDRLYRLALGGTDVVATVCDAARRDALSRRLVPPTRSTVVPNGIRIELFTPASAGRRAALRRALGVADDIRVVGTVGRLNWAKDQRNLISAFAQVHRRDPRTALVLAGKGELLFMLRAHAKAEGVAAAVYFLGDRNDVRELLQGMDVFVLSSVSEGYSMALLEAAASGLPMVATDVGGTREIVRDGETGRLVPAGDPEALASAISSLLEDPDTAGRLARGALDWVRVNGSLATMASRYESLYRPLEPV
ncbi:glycosyltransferase [Dyella sp.]|uniref:glycosyltransferase n=1 Tax=Dyella sp. TaxID=1869338 RepID=UPI002D78687B|nr:glycosyltransferase [Dyella sp.]HET6432960.1 glycosyltransferase [Dyella sp.]